MMGSARSGLFALAVFVLGCGSSSLNQQGPDGGKGACDCRVENLTLTMSWACFCAKFDCTDRQPACAPDRSIYPGCGLTTDSRNAIAPLISVWDESGTLVGRQYASDTSDYQCPSDPTLQGLIVRAGRFPDPACAEVPCACTDGGMTCSGPDAGVDGH
jgi:hypothetical protein